MKKVLSFLFVFSVLNCFFCFAQVSAGKAARKTAERCLKLSENYLLGGNVDAALTQAEMGLSYDDSISDLYYIKAVAKKMDGATVREVLELSKIANDKNLWLDYNEKGNRILYADLLSDTGEYEESLNVLDKEPFVFSADAEAIRIKNYYRIGTDEYLSKARSKVNTARRIYKGDVRFFSLFFGFEISRCIKGGIEYVPEMQVLEIADLLNAELKSYNEVSDELKCLSMFFMEGDEQIRAAKIFSADGGSDSLYPIVALKAGVINQSDALDLFFGYADKAVPMELLKYFASMLTEDEVRQSLYEHLNAYSGTLYADIDSDMQAELEIAYERGRPSSIHFDMDSDGVEDLYGTFDFGELLAVQIKPLGMELYYSPYPWVGRVCLVQGDSTVFYEFSKNALQLSFISFDIPKELEVEGMENKFYIPAIKSSWNDISVLDYLTCATFVRAFSPERDDAVVTYSLLDGNVVSAVYAVNGVLYAAADFKNNLPYERLVDYDNDGKLETIESFMPFDRDNLRNVKQSDKDFIMRAFPQFDYSEKVFLSSVLIDRDNDNFHEFQEFYKENNGKTTTWFSANGKSQIHIRYPHGDGEPVVEESIFMARLDNDKVAVKSIDSIPVSVELNGKVHDVIPGATEKFYWVGTKCGVFDEGEIIDKMLGIDQGTVILLETENRFFLCVKVGSDIFAKKGEHLSLSDMEVTEQEKIEVEDSAFEDGSELAEDEMEAEN